MDGDFAAYVTLRTSVLMARAEPGSPLVIALHGRGMTERALERWLRPGIDKGGISWWVPRGPLPQEMVDDLKVEGCDLTKLVIADARHLPFKGKAFSEIKSCRFVGRGYLVDWKELARVLEDRGLVEALCAYDDTIFHVDFLFDLLEHFPSFKVSVSSLPSRKDYGDSEPIQFDVVYYKRR